MKPSRFKRTGFSRIVAACLYSVEGLGAAFKHEAAFRQEILATVILVPVAILLPISLLETLLLLLVLIMVLVAELLNSGIEATVDLVSPDPQPLAKRAKDLGSAAVFLSLLFAGAVWIVVLAVNYAAITAIFR